MLGYETLAIAYLTALALLAPFTRARRARVWRMVATAGSVIALILILATWMPPAGRAWFGHLYLLAAYWLPALLVGNTTNTRLEGWLSRTEAAWRRRAVRCPASIVTVLDLAYMGCYVLVPIAFVIVWIRGDQNAVDRFWLAVLSAGFVCYGSLPWLVSAPPRLRDASSPSHANAVRRLNLFVLGKLSHGLNTFPSGHVAVSLAAALAVASISPALGGVLLAIAAGIAAGAVAGRYHYVVDVLLGVIAGAAAFIAARV